MEDDIGIVGMVLCCAVISGIAVTCAYVLISVIEWLMGVI
jgi:hypothetical protein